MKFPIRPKKELGQNFLTSEQIALEMVEALELEFGKDKASRNLRETTVVEIGPGLGVLTRHLTKTISEILAVDLDKRAVEFLKQEFSDNSNVKVIEANILDWLPEQGFPHEFKIIGSLPYYITSPILHKIIKLKTLPQVCVFLVQKEVGYKICAQSPDSSYLSSFIQTFFETEYLGTVDKKCFNPVPKVDGGIIKLTKRFPQLVSFEDIYKYEKFLHRAFLSPRKMLNKVFIKEELKNINIDPTYRAQNLNYVDWVKAFEILVLNKEDSK